LFIIFLYRKRKPRKNTTKYGPNAKIPTKRTKRQDKEPENPTAQSGHATVQDENASVQSDHATVQDENASVQAENDTAIVPFVQETSIVFTSPIRPTKKTILQESPIRLTRG